MGKSSFDIKVDNIPCVLSNHVENLKVEQEKLCLCVDEHFKGRLGS